MGLPTLRRYLDFSKTFDILRHTLSGGGGGGQFGKKLQKSEMAYRKFHLCWIMKKCSNPKGKVWGRAGGISREKILTSQMPSQNESM